MIPLFPSHSSGRIGYVAPRLYPEDAKQYFGMTETYDISKIDSILPSIIGNSKSLFTYTTADAAIHKAVTSSLSTLSDLSVKWFSSRSLTQVASSRAGPHSLDQVAERAEAAALRVEHLQQRLQRALLHPTYALRRLLTR